MIGGGGYGGGSEHERQNRGYQVGSEEEKKDREAYEKQQMEAREKKERKKGFSGSDRDDTDYFDSRA